MNTKLKSAVAVCGSLLLSLVTLPSLADDDIAIADLPKVVTQAIMKRYPNAKLIKAEREVDSPGKVHYEVNIRTADKRLELKIRPDGTIYKVENDD